VYFDHAVCPSCKTQFDPEKIATSGGRAACPGCGAGLELKSLFGVSDAFVGVGDDEGQGLNLDDLMKAHPRPGGSGASSVASSVASSETPAPGSALDALRQIRDDRD
jgi:hypothetical protein